MRQAPPTHRAPIKFGVIMFVLIAASSVSIMSTDIYTPSLPHLPALLSTDAVSVKLTVSLNVLMFGFAQMIHGPLSDRFGRKPVLLGAMMLFSAACIGCALAQTIGWLIAARMVQGAMGAAEAVVCLAIFKDLFAEKQQVRALAIFGVSIALAPAAAPILGGYVHVWFGWRANFYLIAALGALVAFLIWRHLPESAPPPSARAGRIRAVLADYRALLADDNFIFYAALTGIGMGVLYVFITGAPFVLINQLGIATEHFGYFQAAIVFAYFVGSLICMRAINFIRAEQLLNIGLALVLCGGVALFGAMLANAINPTTFTAAFALMTFGLAPLFAVAPAKAMLVTDKNAGATAAMLGACEMVVGGLGAFAVGVLRDNDYLAVGAPIAGLLIAAALLILRHRLKRAANPT